MKLSNLPFKMESELIRAWYRLTKGHPGSTPYLSGDGFRALADWVVEADTLEAFDPRQVSQGSLGFCDGWLLREFLERVGPLISVPFCLISHNADPNVTGDVAALFPDSLVRVFAMNSLVGQSHPRVTALPIGLENARWHYNGVVADFEKLRRRSHPKRPRILAAFTVGTNYAARQPALDTLKGLATVDVLSRMNSRAYRKIAAAYGFVASPPGNGEDCHRTWEALYLGAIPIVLRSPMTEEFAARGIPLWLVDSYEELKDFDEGALAQQYQRLSQGLSCPWLWMDAWTEEIRRSVL